MTLFGDELDVCFESSAIFKNINIEVGDFLERRTVADFSVVVVVNVIFSFFFVRCRFLFPLCGDLAAKTERSKREMVWAAPPFTSY